MYTELHRSSPMVYTLTSLGISMEYENSIYIRMIIYIYIPYADDTREVAKAEAGRMSQANASKT